jgi:alanine racemase
LLEHGLTPVVYTEGGVDAIAKAVADAGRTEPLAVHLKVDTGMHRVGCAPEEAAKVARRIVESGVLTLDGLCTHFAVADEPENPYTLEQIARFDDVRAELARLGVTPRLTHAANSPGLLAFPQARYDMVRPGIVIYGIAPSSALAGRVALKPVMALKARVSHVKDLESGARISYGLRYETRGRCRVATVPVGYADGVPRNLAHAGGEVLIRGIRRPIAGTVTMDQLMVDCGDAPVEVGDEVVLIGRQGDGEVTATEWAERLGTIAYEVVAGIGPRVPREYV